MLGVGDWNKEVGCAVHTNRWGTSDLPILLHYEFILVRMLQIENTMMVCAAHPARLYGIVCGTRWGKEKTSPEDKLLIY